MNGIFPLQGVIKNYEWGGTTFIPALLDITNTDKKPFAEYWLGTHPLGISKIELTGGATKPLTEFAGGIPFLFKAQEVKEMLSIQVHPDKKSAEASFRRENEAGIPLDSPVRNYKDDNHKPELVVALAEFWLLHGFKPQEALHDILLNIPALQFLQPVFDKEGYGVLYKMVMEMPQAEVNKHLQPLLDEIIPAYQAGKLEKNTEDFWAARAGLTYCEDGNVDRGIFSIYLLNLVRLKRSEGIFQDAGVPHAYLEGKKNVEIMSNSDNVLRGGLTHKHIAVEELLKHIQPVATYPNILEGKILPTGERIYETTAPDFELGSFELKAGQSATFTSKAPSVLLVTEGVAQISSGETGVVLENGQPAAFLTAGSKCTITANTNTLIFRATEPVHNGV